MDLCCIFVAAVAVELFAVVTKFNCPIKEHPQETQVLNRGVKGIKYLADSRSLQDTLLVS